MQSNIHPLPKKKVNLYTQFDLHIQGLTDFTSSTPKSSSEKIPILMVFMKEIQD